MKRKLVLKKLKELAKAIPEDTYVVEHKFHPNSEFDKDGEELSGYFEKTECNHGRRLKRCYDLGGWVLVNKYLNFYGMELKQSK